MTRRLVSLAVEEWGDLDGYAVAHNMPPLDLLGIDRLTNFVGWWAVQGADQKAREKFESRLWMPPKGEDGQGVWSPDAETAGFMALKQGIAK